MSDKVAQWQSSVERLAKEGLLRSVLTRALHVLMALETTVSFEVVHSGSRVLENAVGLVKHVGSSLTWFLKCLVLSAVIRSWPGHLFHSCFLLFVIKPRGCTVEHVVPGMRKALCDQEAVILACTFDIRRLESSDSAALILGQSRLNLVEGWSHRGVVSICCRILHCRLLLLTGSPDHTAEDSVGLHVVQLLVQLFSLLHCHSTLRNVLINYGKLLILCYFHLAHLFGKLLTVILKAGLGCAKRWLGQFDWSVRFDQLHLLRDVSSRPRW